MVEKEEILSMNQFVQEKTIFALSFVLILFTLKDFILGLFSDSYRFNYFSFIISPQQILNAILIILLISIYFSAFNWITSDFKSRDKWWFRLTQKISHGAWIFAVIYPIFVAGWILLDIFILELISPMINYMGQNADNINIVISVIGTILAYMWINKTSKDTRKVIQDSTLETIGHQIGNYQILADKSKDKREKYFYLYNILGLQIKKYMVKTFGHEIVSSAELNMSQAINFLSNKKLIKMESRNVFHKIIETRNLLAHKDSKISSNDIEIIINQINILEKYLD